jgi:hypothetical protein
MKGGDKEWQQLNMVLVLYKCPAQLLALFTPEIDSVITSVLEQNLLTREVRDRRQSAFT